MKRGKNRKTAQYIACYGAGKRTVTRLNIPLRLYADVLKELKGRNGWSEIRGRRYGQLISENITLS